MRAYGLYIFDLDGTLYRGEEIIPHAVETVAELRSRGAQIRFLTNNSTQTRRFYFEKLSRMGFAPEIREVYSSALGAGAYLKGQGVDHALVVGEEGLFQTLREAGIEPSKRASARNQAVLVGLCRTFRYSMIDQSLQQLRMGARFVATNTDRTFPLEKGRVIPGAGAMVASIERASGVSPFVVGKPNPFLVELILGEAGAPPSECLVVGDRPETDLDSGKAAGCDGFLVLTGATEAPDPRYPSGPDLRSIL